MNRSIRAVWLLLIIALLLTGVGGVVFFSLPFVLARGFVDHLARDGSLETFSRARFDQLRLVGQVAGGVLLALGAAGWIGRAGSQSLLARAFSLAGSWLRRLAVELRELAGALSLRRLSGWEGAVLLLLTLLAAVIRAVYASTPMSHDEAYTVVAFATRPLWIVLSDYHLPNNHVFHSLLVHFSYQLFGLQPWAVRLPVLLSGTLLAPAAYLLARQLYGSRSGWLAVALAAATPWLVRISSDARGYVIICLFTLLAFSLAVYLCSRRSLAGWLLLSMVVGLGFATTPIMLYPAGGVYLWLGLSAWTGDIGKAYASRLQFLRYWLASGFMAGALTLLCYSPILLSGGLQDLVANPFVLPLSRTDFFEQLPNRALETWQTWNTSAAWIGWLLVPGFAVSLLLHRRISRLRVSLFWPLALWMGLVLLVQRPYPWPKLWSFLLPLFLLWSAGGYLGFVEWIGSLRHRRLAAGLALGLTLLAAAGGLLRAGLDFSRAQERGPVEETALYLKAHLQPGDIVVVNSPDDAPLWYYFQLHHIPDLYVIDIRERAFSRAFVLVDAQSGQTLASVIRARGPSPQSFDLSSARPVFSFGNLELFLVYGLPG